MSDVHLTENCGLLDQLLPGDLVLADRGFNIHESAGLYCAEVKVPPFTRGKKQLSKAEIDNSRQLSRVRIHVERVIGLVRQKYSLLRSILSINFIMCSQEEDTSTIDKVATICCALCNCCDSVEQFVYIIINLRLTTIIHFTQHQMKINIYIVKKFYCHFRCLTHCFLHSGQTIYPLVKDKPIQCGTPASDDEFKEFLTHTGTFFSSHHSV